MIKVSSTIRVRATVLLAGCALGCAPVQSHIVVGGRRPGGEGAEREAYRLFREARSLPPTKANLPRIVADYRRALKIMPDPLAEVRLARLLADNGRADEARKIFRSLQSRAAAGQMSIVSNDPSFALDVADTTSKLGLKSLSNATMAGLTAGPIHQIDARFRLPELDRDPAHAKANALFAAGVGKLRVHDNAGAVGLFEGAIKERPDWGTARFMLAYAHAYAGQRAQADAAFEDARRFGWSRPRGL